MLRFPCGLKRLIVAAGAFLFTNGAIAGAFQLYEQSAAGTGNYHAGGAAEANDSSTEYYNPAGMTRIPTQELSLGLVALPIGVHFSGNVNGFPTTTPVIADTLNFVPNFHFVTPLPYHFAFGFGESSPFGLATEYPENITNIASIAASITQLKVANLNPNLAFAINDHLSIGAGFDYLYAEAEYDNLIPAGVLSGPLLFANSKFKNVLSGNAEGYNLGVLLQFTDTTRIGISYRSELKIAASGTSQVLASPFPNGAFIPFLETAVSTALPLPPSTLFSIYQDVTPRFALMGSATYTQWDVFKNIVLQNTALTSPGSLIVPQNYQNSWNFAVGGNYRINDKTMIKVGGGFDETPTQNGFRDIRLPDANRIAIAAGVHYDATPQLAFDGGWIHFFMQDGNVDNSQSVLQSNFAALPLVVGNSNNSVDVVGVEVSYAFAAL